MSIPALVSPLSVDLTNTAVYKDILDNFVFQLLLGKNQKLLWGPHTFGHS